MVNIGRYDDSYLLSKADELVVEKTKGSRVMDPEEEKRVPQFGPNGKFDVEDDWLVVIVWLTTLPD